MISAERLLYPVLWDAMLYAATALVLCLTSREFRLFNLAAGAWLVVGGWLGSAAFALFIDASVPIRPAWLLALILLLLLQVAGPFLLGRRLSENPLSYLFWALGVALTVETVMISGFLESSAATIPFSRPAGAPFILLLAVIVVSATVLVVLSSKFWAVTAIQFRVSDLSKSARWHLCALLAIEALLILALGGAGWFVHKGIIRSAEDRTIIPLLACVATKGRPSMAFVWSFLAVALTHTITAFSTTAGLGKMLPYSNLLIIIFFVGHAVFKEWPRRPMVQSRTVEPVPAKMNLRVLVQDPVFRHHFAGGLAFCLSVLVAIIAWTWWPTYFTDEIFHRTLLVMVLSLIAWLALKYLGILSLAWPAVGALAAYAMLWFRNDNIGIVSFFFVLLLCCFLYFFAIRVLSAEISLLFDISSIVILFGVFQATESLSGTEDVLTVKLLPLLQLSSFAAASLQVVIVLILALAVPIVASTRRWRVWVLGLCNFSFGALNNIPVRLAFMCVAGFLALLASASTLLHKSVQATVSPSLFSLEQGLSVLLLGYLSERAGLLAGVGATFFVYAVLGSSLLGQGVWLTAATGIGFVICSLTLPRGGSCDS